MRRRSSHGRAAARSPLPRVGQGQVGPIGGVADSASFAAAIPSFSRAMASSIRPARSRSPPIAFGKNRRRYRGGGAGVAESRSSKQAISVRASSIDPAPRASREASLSAFQTTVGFGPSAVRERRAGLAISGVVACFETGDGPGLGQLPAERAPPAAACQQGRGLGPAACAAELLGPRDGKPLVGAELEHEGELGLAVGLAAELAVDGGSVLVQARIVRPGGDESVEIAQGLGPAPEPAAVGDAMSLEIEDLIR